ncbi:hypothetical protein [Clostridium tagluense]|uniref:hypothetical protein n=1 Tax=Clostridium tagluense TaxID=360422 RepID=UPI000F623B2D|nr:hypothetical protein [Clostridium tagluense]
MKVKTKYINSFYVGTFFSIGFIFYIRDYCKRNDVVVAEDKAIEPTSFNLDDIIDKSCKNSKNKTYYLETSAINEVKKIAKKQKISESKLVNDILKHVLGIK